MDIRKLNDEEVDAALEFSFHQLIDTTQFFKFKDYYDLALKKYKELARNYHQENNTLFIGYYLEDKLVGLLEINDCYINQIAVDRNFRNQGIGYNLFFFAIRNKKDGEIVCLDAAMNSVHYYEKWGFVINGELNKKTNSIKMKYTVSNKNKSYW